MYFCEAIINRNEQFPSSLAPAYNHCILTAYFCLSHNAWLDITGARS